jgi:hypothetical protein
MRKPLTLAALVLALAGCAGSNYDIARRHDNLRDYKGPDAGFVVASEGGERGGHFDSSGLTFQRVGSEDLVTFGFAMRKLIGVPDHDFEAGSAIGRVDAKRLPPGDYEAIDLFGVQNVNGGQFRRKLAPGTLRFTVKTGETVYLGRYVIGEMRFSPRLLISDSQAADMALAKTRLHELTDAVVTSAVPPEGHRQF